MLFPLPALRSTLLTAAVALLLLAIGAVTPVAEDSSPPPQLVGRTGILFDEVILADLGVELRAPLSTAEPVRDGGLGFAIPAPVQLDYTGAFPSTKGFSSGSLGHIGGFTLAFHGLELQLHGFELRVAEAPFTFDLYDGNGDRWFRVDSLQYDYSNDGTELQLINASLVMSPEFAKVIGRSDLTHSYVGVIDTMLPIELPTQIAASGALAFTTTGSCPLPDPMLDIDVALTGLNSLTQLAREPGGRVAIAPSADLTNVGVGSVEWFRSIPPDDQASDLGPHPYLALHFYRLVGGRLEQIGQGDVKHAFLSINTGCPCEPGHTLFPGCSDVYSHATNAFHKNLGPRDEVSAFTGAWNRVGSHFDSFSAAMGAIDPTLTDDFRSHDGIVDHPDTFTHRLVVQESDLQTGGGAEYFMEAWYVVKDDIDILNSMGHRRVIPTFAGETWSFTTTTALANGSILDVFVNPTNPVPGALSTSVDTGEGRLQLAVKTSSLVSGDVHFEYALMNFDFDRQIDSFSVPLQAGITITNAEFGDNDGNAANDWTVVVTPGVSVVFTAPAGNSLDWGTLYNFAFDSNTPAAAGNVTLSAFEAGAGLAAVATLTPDPAGIPPMPGDNDACANRRSIGTGTTFSTLSGASNDGSSAEDVDVLRDVWFEFTPSRTGVVRIYTCGTSDIPTVDNGVDTILSVHSGCLGTTGNEIYGNNDAPFFDAFTPTDVSACMQIAQNGEVADQGFMLDSAIALNLSQGVPVVIRVAERDDFGADDFLLTVLEPPVNDVFTSPTVAGDGTTNGTLDQASEDFPFDFDDPNRVPSQPDVWYRFNPTSTGDVRINTCGTFSSTGLDTTLDVFDVNTVTFIDGDDDYEFGSDPTACSGPSSSFLDSSVAFGAVLTNPIDIRVSRFQEGASGDFILNIDDNPPFDVTLAALPTVVGVGGDTTLRWYAFQSNGCTASGAWSGPRAKSGSEVVSPTATGNYRLDCTPTAGGASDFAEVSVSVLSLANDVCATPAVIAAAGLPFSDVVDTSIASADAGDPDTSVCSGAPTPEGATVWYSFTPTTSEPIQVSTVGSDYDTVVSVWNATPGCGSLTTQIACSDDTPGSAQSELIFAAQAGTPYLIKVGDWGSGPGGRLDLRVPEPATSLLWLGALATLIGLRRRRR